MDIYDLPYYQKLEKIHETLRIQYQNNSNYERYITNRCQTTSRLVKIITGVDEQGGKVGELGHIWNVDNENKVIVDLSAWQFYDFNIKPTDWIFKQPSRIHRTNPWVLEEHLKDMKKNRLNVRNEIRILLQIYNNL